MTDLLRRSTLLAAAACVALAGCSDAGTDSVEAEKGESAASVAKKVANSDVRPSPGRWESEMKIEKMEIPGMPPEVQKMMEAQIAKVQKSSSCLTKEEAEKMDGEFFQPGNEEDCTYDKFKMADGKLDAVMKCTAGGRTQNMTMKGTYSDQAYTMNVTADGEIEAGKTMNMAMSISSKRTGECTGDEDV